MALLTWTPRFCRPTLRSVWCCWSWCAEVWGQFMASQRAGRECRYSWQYWARALKSTEGDWSNKKSKAFNSFLSGHMRYEGAKHRDNWIIIQGMIQASFYIWFCSLLIKSKDWEVERGLGVNGHDVEASWRLIGLSWMKSGLSEVVQWRHLLIIGVW